MNVDRYITDEVVRRSGDELFNFDADSIDDAKAVMRVTLPGILAQHRADVLRQAADRVMPSLEGLVVSRAERILAALAGGAVAE